MFDWSAMSFTVSVISLIRRVCSDRAVMSCEIDVTLSRIACIECTIWSTTSAPSSPVRSEFLADSTRSSAWRATCSAALRMPVIVVEISVTALACWSAFA